MFTKQKNPPTQSLHSSRPNQSDTKVHQHNLSVSTSRKKNPTVYKNEMSYTRTTPAGQDTRNLSWTTRKGDSNAQSWRLLRCSYSHPECKHRGSGKTAVHHPQPSLTMRSQSSTCTTVGLYIHLKHQSTTGEATTERWPIHSRVERFRV